MVWGWGVGKVAWIDGRMTAEHYCEILATNLASTIDACTLLPDFAPRNQLVFQQDNDPKHTPKLAASWFRGQGVLPMPWPSQSPDLNPIEHLWQQLTGGDRMTTGNSIKLPIIGPVHVSSGLKLI
jgi:hypothetical protein